MDFLLSPSYRRIHTFIQHFQVPQISSSPSSSSSAPSSSSSSSSSSQDKHKEQEEPQHFHRFSPPSQSNTFLDPLMCETKEKEDKDEENKETKQFLLSLLNSSPSSSLSFCLGDFPLFLTVVDLSHSSVGDLEIKNIMHSLSHCLESLNTQDTLLSDYGFLDIVQSSLGSQNCEMPPSIPQKLREWDLSDTLVSTLSALNSLQKYPVKSLTRIAFLQKEQEEEQIPALLPTDLLSSVFVSNPNLQEIKCNQSSVKRLRDEAFFVLPLDIDLKSTHELDLTKSSNSIPLSSLRNLVLCCDSNLLKVLRLSPSQAQGFFRNTALAPEEEEEEERKQKLLEQQQLRSILSFLPQDVHLIVSDKINV